MELLHWIANTFSNLLNRDVDASAEREKLDSPVTPSIDIEKKGLDVKPFDLVAPSRPRIWTYTSKPSYNQEEEDDNDSEIFSQLKSLMNGKMNFTSTPSVSALAPLHTSTPAFSFNDKRRTSVEKQVSPPSQIPEEMIAANEVDITDDVTEVLQTQPEIHKTIVVPSNITSGTAIGNNAPSLFPSNVSTTTGPQPQPSQHSTELMVHLLNVKARFSSNPTNFPKIVYTLEKFAEDFSRCSTLGIIDWLDSFHISVVLGHQDWKLANEVQRQTSALFINAFQVWAVQDRNNMIQRFFNISPPEVR